MTRFSRAATTETRAALARVAPNGIPYQSPVVCELVERRTERSKSFLHADGAVTTVARGRPLHRWHAATGMWLDIGPLAALTDFTGGTTDGAVRGSSTTYATARSTSTSYNDSATTTATGQSFVDPDYVIRRTFLIFDTSAITDTDTVVSASLYLKAYSDQSDTDFNLQVYRFAWVGTWATPANMEADYDGAYGGSATLEGTFRNTADGWVTDTWYSMALAVAGISKTGDSKYALASSRDIAGNEPTGNELAYYYSADSVGNEPYLAITTAPLVSVSAVAATATAAAAVPAVVGGANVAAVAAAASAAGIGGATFTLDMIFDVDGPAVAAAAAPVPHVAEVIHIYAVPAAATAAGVDGATFILDMDFGVDGPATAAGAALIPTFLLGAGVAAIAATATADGLAPTIILGAGVTPPAATAIAAASAPTIVTERLSPLMVKINGTDRTAHIPVDSITIDNVVTNRVTSCTFHIISGQSLALAEMQSVIVSNPEETIRWFAGFIRELKEISAGPNLDYEIDCVDYSWLLEHPEALITATYTAQNDSAVITAAMATGCPDIEASTYIETVFSAVPNLEFKQATPREILDKLAEMSGAYWYVDYGPGPGVQLAYLHYFDAATNDAPFDLSDTPNGSTTYSYERLTRIKAAPDANRLEIKGGNDILVTRTLGLEGDYGRWITAKLVDSDIQSAGQANTYGDNLLAQMASNPSYTLTVYREGLRAGQVIELTNAARSLSASAQEIKRVTTTFLGGGQAQYKLEIGKYLPKLADLLAKELGGGGGGAPDEELEEELEDWIDDIFNVHYHDVTGNTSTASGHTHDAGTLAAAGEAAHTHAVGSLAAANESSHTHAVGTLAAAGEASHTHGAGTLATGGGSSHSHAITTASANSGTANTTHAHSIAAMCCNVSTELVGSPYEHSHTASTPGATSGYEGAGHYHAYDRSPATTGNEASHTHNVSSGATQAGSSHTHALSGSTAAGSAHTHSMSGSTAAGSSHTHSLSGATASGGSHSHTADGTLATGAPILA